MILNPFSSSVQKRDGIPMLPGAFPSVGHPPAFRRSAPEVIAEQRPGLGSLLGLHVGSLSNEHWSTTHSEWAQQCRHFSCSTLPFPVLSTLVKLGRQWGRRGFRPKLLAGADPNSEYLPLNHPAVATTVLVE